MEKEKNMADSKELKPVSYRIDDETKEKFKQIATELGGNQQETMNTLINAYYLQSKQNGLEEFQGTIDQFQAYITSIVTMYTNSLQANHDMKASVMQEFEALLQSKDTTIQDLQKKLETAKQSEEEAKRISNAYVDENKRLNGYIENLQKEYNSKLDDMQSMLADKEKANQTLTDHSESLKMQLKDCEDIKEQLKELESLKEENKRLQDQLKEKDFEHKNAILDFEREKQNEISELKNKHIADIEHYQNQYKELLEKLEKKESNSKSSASTRRKKTVEKTATAE